VQQIESAIHTLHEAIKCFDFKVIKDRTLPDSVDHVYFQSNATGLPYSFF